MERTCPICGSKNIRVISSATNQYRCLSCDDSFTLSNELKLSNVATLHNNELSANNVYSKNIESIVEVVCMFGEDMSSGTGFYISNDGYILTNAHVVVSIDKNKEAHLCDSVYISKNKTDDYKELEIVYMDSKNDLVLLKSNETDTKPVTFSNEKLSIGDKIYAIGNSKGYGLMLLDGIISDLDRDFNGHKTFLFNALVTHGCSGGPIFNSKGELCGMTEGGSTEAPGMNYGIDYSILKNFIRGRKLYGRI